MIVPLIPSYGDTLWKIRLVCGYKELSQKLCSLSEEWYPLVFAFAVYVVLIFRGLGRSNDSEVIKDYNNDFLWKTNIK